MGKLLASDYDELLTGTRSVVEGAMDPSSCSTSQHRMIGLTKRERDRSNREVSGLRLWAVLFRLFTPFRKVFGGQHPSKVYAKQASERDNQRNVLIDGRYSEQATRPYTSSGTIASEAKADGGTAVWKIVSQSDERKESAKAKSNSQTLRARLGTNSPGVS